MIIKERAMSKTPEQILEEFQKELMENDLKAMCRVVKGNIVQITRAR